MSLSSLVMGSVITVLLYQSVSHIVILHPRVSHIVILHPRVSNFVILHRLANHIVILHPSVGSHYHKVDKTFTLSMYG